MTAAIFLAVVSGWHAAFQLTVSAIVYPTLLERTSDFADAHTRHSRRILVLVIPTYAAVLVASAWRLASGDLGPATLVAVAAHALVLAITALSAAPAHAALGREGLTAQLASRLRTADWLRTAGSLVGLAAALVAVG